MPRWSRRLSIITRSSFRLFGPRSTTVDLGFSSAWGQADRTLLQVPIQARNKLPRNLCGWRLRWSTAVSVCFFIVMMGCASVRSVFFAQLQTNARDRVVHLEEDLVLVCRRHDETCPTRPRLRALAGGLKHSEAVLQGFSGSKSLVSPAKTYP